MLNPTLLEPKEIMIDDKQYIISKFPAVAGREIIAKYLPSLIPKIGDYKVNEETMLKIMSYVAVDIDGKRMSLSNRALIDNHVKSWEILARIEVATMEYNVSFFQKGGILGFFEDAAKNMPPWISKMSTGLLDRLLPAAKQPSTN